MPLSEKEIDRILEYWANLVQEGTHITREEAIRRAWHHLATERHRRYTVSDMAKIISQMRGGPRALIGDEIDAYPWQYGQQGRDRRREVEFRRVERVAHQIAVARNLPGLEAAFERWHLGVPRIAGPAPSRVLVPVGHIAPHVVEAQRRLLEDAAARKRGRDDDGEDQSASASSADSSSKKYPRGSGLRKRKR